MSCALAFLSIRGGKRLVLRFAEEKKECRKPVVKRLFRPWCHVCMINKKAPGGALF
jgi:hypothetical protein